MIAFDAQSSLNQNTLAQVWALSHTMGSGANGYLLVTVYAIDNPTSSAPTVTYNGVSMTQLITYDDSLGTNIHTCIFGLVAPASGSHNVVATFPGSETHTGILGAVSFIGVNQINPTDGITGSKGATTTASFSNSITTNFANEIVIDFAAGPPTITPGQTSVGWTNSTTQYQGSYQTTTTAGSYTNSWTCSNFYAWIDIILALRPFVYDIYLDNFASGTAGSGSPISQIQFNLSIASTASVIVVGAIDISGYTQFPGITSVTFGPYTMFPCPGGLSSLAGFLFYLPNNKGLSGSYLCTINSSKGGATQLTGFAASYIGTDKEDPIRVTDSSDYKNVNGSLGQQSTTYSLSTPSQSGDLVLHTIGINSQNNIGTPSLTYATSEVQDGGQTAGSTLQMGIYLAEKAGAAGSTTVSFNVGTSTPNNFLYFTETIVLQPPVNKGLFFAN